jgi:hypothetical protein
MSGFNIESIRKDTGNHGISWHKGGNAPVFHRIWPIFSRKCQFHAPLMMEVVLTPVGWQSTHEKIQYSPGAQAFLPTLVPFKCRAFFMLSASLKATCA